MISALQKKNSTKLKEGRETEIVEEGSQKVLVILNNFFQLVFKTFNFRHYE